MPPPAIVDLQADDLRQLENLLRSAGLPTADCAGLLRHFVGMFDGGELVASGALEPAGEFALLRSVAVAAKYRGRGHARAIVEFLIERARLSKYRALYLLTETADGYFTAFGFSPVARERVPAGIAGTRQFTALCPDSARCLVLALLDR